MAIVAFVLVAIPVAFAVRGLATACEFPHFPHFSHAGPPAWVRQHCLADPGRVIATIKVCSLVVGVALFGGGIGWFVAARRHWPRRWPSAATGAFIAMSVLYAWDIWFGILTRLGDWNW
jgi:hypothetical protein